VSGGAYALVVLSAATHAYWNFLLKKSGGDHAVVASSKVVEAMLLAPLLLAVTPEWPALAAWWHLPVVGAVLVLLNYVFLAAAYRRGDLSLVYPVSRGAILVFLPALALVTIGERLDAAGSAAIAVIVAGIAVLQLPTFDAAAGRAWAQGLRAPATLFSLAAALVAAVYTVWDKRAVQVLSPLSYFAAYSVIVGAVYGIGLCSTGNTALLKRIWHTHRGVIVQVAALNSVSYLMALAALQSSKASYVIALRQLSIAAGAMLGWWVLGEALPLPRRVGIAMLLLGCVLLALAR
jgi:uncharacterized membrane protein